MSCRAPTRFPPFVGVMLLALGVGSPRDALAFDPRAETAAMQTLGQAARDHATQN